MSDKYMKNLTFENIAKACRIRQLMLREHNCRPLLKHSRNEFVSVHPFSLYRDKKIALLHLSAVYDGAGDR